jgi:transposase-like protein
VRGRHGYGPDTRLRAKALWIVGNLTDDQIAAQVGVQRPETIGEWRRAEQWDIERDIIQQETERRVSAAVAETISEMNSRHLKEFQLMQSKAVQALRGLEPTKASEAAAMLDAGIRGERLVRGEPTEVREVRAPDAGQRSGPGTGGCRRDQGAHRRWPDGQTGWPSNSPTSSPSGSTRRRSSMR